MTESAGFTTSVDAAASSNPASAGPTVRSVTTQEKRMPTKLTQLGSNKLSEFDKLVADIHRSGFEWAEIKLKADQLKEDAKPYLASLMNELDDGKLAEAKIKRLAEGSEAYRKHITAMCIARAEALKKQVEYESYCNLFEARRTEAATNREIYKKGIFDQGK